MVTGETIGGPALVARPVDQSRQQRRFAGTSDRGDDDDAGRRWFAVHCQTGKERTAQANLQRQDFGAFMPLLRCQEVRAGRTRDVLRPLFPGYVFAGFDPRVAAWRRINGTFGVKRLITFGETPEPVPARLMADLRQACDEEGVFSFHRAYGFRTGDRVKLSAGPFKAMIGTIDSMSGPERARLLLSILGRTTRVSVALEDLQLIA